MKLSLVNKL